MGPPAATHSHPAHQAGIHMPTKPQQILLPAPGASQLPADTSRQPDAAAEQLRGQGPSSHDQTGIHILSATHTHTADHACGNTTTPSEQVSPGHHDIADQLPSNRSRQPGTACPTPMDCPLPAFQGVPEQLRVHSPSRTQPWMASVASVGPALHASGGAAPQAAEGGGSLSHTEAESSALDPGPDWQQPGTPSAGPHVWPAMDHGEARKHGLCTRSRDSKQAGAHTPTGPFLSRINTAEDGRRSEQQASICPGSQAGLIPVDGRSAPDGARARGRLQNGPGSAHLGCAHATSWADPEPAEQHSQPAGAGDGLQLHHAQDPQSCQRCVDIACGARHSAAVTRDGRLFLWGSSLHGQVRPPPPFLPSTAFTLFLFPFSAAEMQPHAPDSKVSWGSGPRRAIPAAADISSFLSWAPRSSDAGLTGSAALPKQTLHPTGGIHQTPVLAEGTL